MRGRVLARRSIKHDILKPCQYFRKLHSQRSLNAVIRNQLADKDQIAGLKAGLEIAAKDYLKAMRIRSLIQKELRKLFIDVSILVTPTTFAAAPKAGERLRGIKRDRPKPASRGLHDLVPAGNLAGLPALSLPCGFDNGLPLGICLVGRPFYENTLLAVGREFQNQTDWHRRRPPIGS